MNPTLFALLGFLTLVCLLWPSLKLEAKNSKPLASCAPRKAAAKLLHPAGR
jgi:hypothetical protein